MIYSFVAREKQVLIEYSPHSGNFRQIAVQDVLANVNMGKMFGQYVTLNHNFYLLVKDKYVFLTMVEKNYELRIASSFLKKIQQLFYEKYDAETRKAAIAHSMKDFKSTLKQCMEKYNNKSEVDKLSKAKQLLDELNKQCLENMDMILERGEKISIIVDKSKVLGEGSLDMLDNAEKLRKKMWWSSNKFKIGVGLVIVIALFVLILLVASK